MLKAAAFAVGLISVTCFAAPALAQQTASFTYACNVEGALAQLTTRVQAVSSTGVFLDPAGMFAGAAATGDVNFFYEGELVSNVAHYTFSGTNQYADFLDANNRERFRVQMIVEGQTLRMIINPQGPGPVQYLCQMTGRQ